jgi:hypothetical protein
MTTTFDITSYDSKAGEHMPGKNLDQNVSCLNVADAIRIAELLRADGYGVLVQRRTMVTSGTIKELSR